MAAALWHLFPDYSEVVLPALQKGAHAMAISAFHVKIIFFPFHVELDLRRCCRACRLCQYPSELRVAQSGIAIARPS